MEAFQVEIINLAIFLLAGFVGWISKHAVAFLKNKGLISKLEANKELVRIAVTAVEQTYKTLHGKEKLEYAKMEVIELAQKKGIKISEKEIDLLIESTVKEMNKNINEELKK